MKNICRLGFHSNSLNHSIGDVCCSYSLLRVVAKKGVLFHSSKNYFDLKERNRWYAKLTNRRNNEHENQRYETNRNVAVVDKSVRENEHRRIDYESFLDKRNDSKEKVFDQSDSTKFFDDATKDANSMGKGRLSSKKSVHDNEVTLYMTKDNSRGREDFVAVPVTTKNDLGVDIHEGVPQVNTFKLSLSNELNTVLKEKVSISNPTDIQRLAIPIINKGSDVLIAAQTGCGKTFSYLLPIIDKLKKLENAETDKSVKRLPSRPRAIIIVPTKELVTQLLSVIKTISHEIKLRSIGLRSDYKLSRMKKELSLYPVDIVVSTPGIFIKMFQSKDLYISDTRFLVLDEADTLFSKGFKEEITEHVLYPFLSNKKKKEKHMQIIFALATFNAHIKQVIQTHIPNMKRVFTPNLHKNLSHVDHKFVSSVGKDKLRTFLEGLRENHNEESLDKTLIFCNTVSSCRAIHHTITDLGYKSACYHSEMPKELQKSNFDSFKKDVKYMVCSDIASRGIDIQEIKHVIMFDFPMNAIDYLHRAGRTGRMNTKDCKVTSFLSKRDLVLADAIRDALKRKLPIEGLTSDRKANEEYIFDRIRAQKRMTEYKDLKPSLKKRKLVATEALRRQKKQ